MQDSKKQKKSQRDGRLPQPRRARVIEPRRMGVSLPHDLKVALQRERDRPSPLQSDYEEVRVFEKKAELVGEQAPVPASKLGADESDMSGSALARSLLDQGAIYRFRITDTFPISSSAGGIIAQSITCNPSSMNEYADLSALFEEVRLIEASIVLVNVSPGADASTQTKNGCLVAFNEGVTSSTPSSYDAVWAIGGCKCHHLAKRDNSVFRYKPAEREWATTNAPVPGPYAGCYGAWQLYDNGLNNSTLYFNILQESVFEFRMRT